MASQGDRGPLMYAVFSIFFVLPLVAVALRILSRRMSRVSLWWDDWLLLVAAVIVILNFVFLAETLQNGAGKHIDAGWPPQRLENFLIYTYANEITYASIVTCIKTSILCLYLRLFGINKKFAKIIKCFIVAVVAWGVATLLTSIFQCRPVSGAWNISIPRDRCFDLRAWLIATNVPNIAIDFSVILLPMPLVWQLKLSTARKIGLTGVFLLGTLASVISIVRVHANASIKNTDPTWDYVPVMIWSTVEGNLGVVCACCPVLAPLVRQCFGRSASTTPRSSKDPPSANGFWRARPDHRDQSFSRLQEDYTADRTYPGEANSVRIQKSPELGNQGDSAMELGSIYVTSNVDIESTRKV